MVHAGNNYLAILIAAIVSYGFGALYYGALSKPWLRALGRDGEQPKSDTRIGPYVVAFIALFVMAVVFAGLVGHLGPGQVTLRNGLISAGFVWAGFVMTTLAVNYAFQGARPSLTLIDGGHWLGVLLIQGAIIGVMGI